MCETQSSDVASPPADHELTDAYRRGFDDARKTNRVLEIASTIVWLIIVAVVFWPYAAKADIPVVDDREWGHAVEYLPDQSSQYYPYWEVNNKTVWLTSGTWSLHPNEDHYHYNQTNYGWGLAYQVDNRKHGGGVINYIAGDYDNSLNHDSKYFGVINQPWGKSTPWGDLRLGYLVGIVSGYTKTPKFAPAFAPEATYEYGGVGVNLVWIPSVVVAVQIKAWVW